MSASFRPQGPILVGVFLLVGLEWLTSLAVAQKRQPNSQTGIQEPMRTASALRVDRVPRLDGRLNDPLWQQATPTNSFLQRELFEGQAPTEKIEVRIVYDRHDASLSPRTRPNTTKIDSPSNSHTPGVREVNMKWITRKDKVDRVACPWLIKRFVDPQAEFLFVEEKDLLEHSKQLDAIPFDAPKIEAIKLNHRGSRCSFEAILEDYSVSDPALQKLALIVRAADVKGQESAAPEGIGLRSIAQGFAALGISDEERLVRQFPVYDALYAYVQSNG